MQWLYPRNWSRLKEGDLEVSDLKRNIFFSQLCVLGALFTVFQVLDDFAELNVYLMPSDIATFFMWPLGWWLNEKGHHRFAKCLLIGYLNILFFVMCSLLDPGIHFDLMFYPLLMLTFMTMGSNDKHLAYLFGLLSLTLLLILSFTDGRPFGSISIMAPTKFQEVLNVITAAIFTGACSVFIIELHVRAEKSLRQKKDQLAKANEELDRFVYSASHDMRAPLLSIQGLVNIARMEASGTTQTNQYFDMIMGRTRKLDDLIHDITNYSRNSRLPVDLKSVNLADLVNEAEEKLRYLDGVSSITITKKITGETKALLDGGRLSILINNLLSNAIKYHDHHKAQRWVDVEIDNGVDVLRLTVRDNGQGIDPNHQEKIFQMFYRATDNAQGSGLGLYIVKEITDKLNGSISVVSEKGKGSEFTVIVPHTLPMN